MVDYVKTIDLFCDAEQAALHALKWHMVRHYEVEIEVVEQNKHYILYLYK